GKSFTSVCCGIMLQENRDRIPDGLEQKVFTERYLPEAFPLNDPRKAEIKLGHLLAMTSGMREGRTGIVKGEVVDLGASQRAWRCGLPMRCGSPIYCYRAAVGVAANSSPRITSSCAANHRPTIRIPRSVCNLKSMPTDMWRARRGTRSSSPARVDSACMPCHR